MSVFVDHDGKPMTYVVVDTNAKTIICTVKSVGPASRALVNACAGRALHNLTHSTCPDWVKELVKEDAAYCFARATELGKSANRLRREAAASLTEADRIQVIADQWGARAGDRS